MKFKNDHLSGGRTLSLSDKEGDTLSVMSFKHEKGSYDVVVQLNTEAVGLSRSKALKLAWAIIEELNPSVL